MSLLPLIEVCEGHPSHYPTMLGYPGVGVVPTCRWCLKVRPEVFGDG